jgi:hypothetical protein
MIPTRYLCISLALLTLPAVAQIPSRNVNMVSGTKWPDGDPFLQRQNEPSLAVSSRNPAHILAGANDYRTVDLPGLPSGETGDAWLGIFKSYDGGQTWRSTVHPGCPQSIAACDGAPLLKSYGAGADPVVRAGTSGMFYYSGIAFTRDAPKQSVVFVSRFIDNNNEENGDPIKYLGTVAADTGSGGVFLDKPWLAVDIPRAGAVTCQISAPQKNGNPLTQSFPGGNVYLAYTAFTDETQPPSRIFFARSTDCGATWSRPAAIADGALHQGATIAIDPGTGAVYVAWRRFKSAGITDAILFAKSTDGGATFSAPQEVAVITPFDQGTTTFSFRTNGYPTMAVDGKGRVYIAWTERNQGSLYDGGDARVVLVTSADAGVHWFNRVRVADSGGRGHQLMPAMTFAGGKLMLVFYDVRDDSTVGNFTSLNGGKYVETRVPAGDLATTPAHPERVFTNFLADAAPLLRRHTIDVWAAQADPADFPVFTGARVSQYIFGSRSGSQLIEQLQVNPPNLPLFKQGSAPFMGDYLDIAASPSFLPGDKAGAWKFNTDPSSAVIFHAAWADNRDVRPPANGDWKDYTPPTSASSSGTSIFDPSQPQAPCRTGQAGMRNQNVYTARITQGLLVGSPSNTKVLGKFTRTFPVVVANSTARGKTFRLTIAGQPKNGKASFLEAPVAGQTDPLTVFDVNVGPGSSVSRMVFVTSSDPAATVRVDVAEVSAPGAGLVSGGLQGSVLLNPDPGNPANPDIANGELFNPDIANPDIANPDIANPDIANPDVANPDIANPDIANPDIANPDIANPDIANPDIANPDIANPDIANPDIANGAISDVTWKITNKGNTTATYTIQFLLNNLLPNRIKTQLVIHKTYTTPVSNGCSLVVEPHAVVIVNVSKPPLVSRAGAKLPRAASQAAGDAIDNATISIGAGDTLNITLRFVDPAGGPLPFDPGKTITVVANSQAVNSGSFTNGNNPPAGASNLIVATTSLPTAIAGAPGYDTFLVAAGGTGAYSWSVVGGSLPPGLSLSANGEIKGTIDLSAGASYTFTVQVTDSANPAHTVTQDLTILVSRVALAISVAAAGPQGASVKPGDTITVTASVSSSGAAADGVTPGISVIATGTATATCGGPNPVSTNFGGIGTQSFTFLCTGVSGLGTLTFNVGLTATDHASGAPISAGPVSSNTVSVVALPGPTITSSATSNGAPYAQGVWTRFDVTVTFLCTPATGDPITKTVTVTTEGANQTVTFTCSDILGNKADASYTGIYIDKTPPSITLTSKPSPNAAGWYNSDVTMTWQCVDNFAGTSTVTRTVSTEGFGQFVTATCLDFAGNTSTDTQSVNIDKTPPVLTGVTTPPMPSSGWFHGPVTVTFNCTDSISGVAAGYPTGNTTLNTDTSGTLVPGTCRDVAGNLATINFGPIQIDTVGPLINLISPLNNFTYPRGSTLFATYHCSDASSGIASCIGTVATGQRLDTSTPGTYSFSVTATDLAGNTTTVTRTYFVGI